MIKNITSGKKLVSKKKFARTTFEKARGLMFTFPIKDFGLIFEFKKPIRECFHMFFVFYPIGMIFLDDNKRVVDLRKFAIPFWPAIIPKKKFMYVLEVPVGVIEKSKTKEGDTISF